ncbi:Lrp/AsnC family transcriptional regulator [Nocardioides sp. B-3]|uniref:Lrp/AsnC family transcriptional regulator n=1 Tax=Nocardioides sp. B-3 TaxID=2895565 RepID=UPI002153360A|nr:AsnC family transcriptional regulator [Nocardioides sp. B-3]UUZ61226.1 AsnC family transcriptional regulator [Nocardioides sp. B-3]
MPRPGSPTDHAALDAVDLRILSELTEDGRITNSALAARVGIAESTCPARVRSLRERAIVRGVHADVDPAALGFPIRGRDQGAARQPQPRPRGAVPPGAPRDPGRRSDPARRRRGRLSPPESPSRRPSSCADPVLEHINVHPIVRHTETQLVFEEMVGAGVL